MKKGVVIARLDNADYQAAVSQQQANVAASQAQVIEANRSATRRSGNTTA